MTSAQPSASPRVVKEAKAFANAGYEVKVIYAPLSPWADEYDRRLFSQTTSIQWIKVGFHPMHQYWKYTYARLRRKIYEKFFGLGMRKISSDYAIALFVQELYKATLRHPADLYIAHNLGALPAAAKAAQKNKAIVAFDAEDFHRGEDTQGGFHWQLASYLEEKYLPQVHWLSAASPLIEEAYKKIFPSLSSVTINNVFPIGYLQKKPITDTVTTLKLFWFSQSIGKKRGIEDVIRAMGILKNKNVRLTLLGNISSSSRQYFFQLMQECGVATCQVNFLDPVEEYKIVELAAEHHVGLALEVPYCLNRKLCLTNKIFLYLLAGNAIIFSETAAQKNIAQENVGIGRTYESGSAKQLAALLEFYQDHPYVLSQQRINAWNKAREKWNWENESKKLHDIVHKTLMWQS